MYKIQDFQIWIFHAISFQINSKKTTFTMAMQDVTIGGLKIATLLASWNFRLSKLSAKHFKIELNNFVAHHFSWNQGGSLSFIYSYQNAVIWHPWVPPVSHNLKFCIVDQQCTCIKFKIFQIWHFYDQMYPIQTPIIYDYPFNSKCICVGK